MKRTLSLLLSLILILTAIPNINLIVDAVDIDLKMKPSAENSKPTPTPTATETVQKNINDVTVYEFLSDLWLDDCDKYENGFSVTGIEQLVDFYADCEGNMNIAMNEVKADASLRANILAWEVLTFPADIGSTAENLMNPHSRYDVILIELLKEALKNQEIIDNIVKNSSEQTEVLEAMITKRFNEQGIDCTDGVGAEELYATVEEATSLLKDASILVKSGESFIDIQTQLFIFQKYGDISAEEFNDWIKVYDKLNGKFEKTTILLKDISAGAFCLGQVFKINDFITTATTLNEISDINEGYIAFLDEMYTNTNNGNLKKSISMVKNGLSSAKAAMAYSFTNFILEEIALLLEVVWDELIANSFKALFPWLTPIQIAYETTIALIDFGFGTSDTIEKIYISYAFCDIFNAVQNTYYAAKAKYNANNNTKNAQLFVAAFDMLFITMIKDCDYAKQYWNQVFEGGALSSMLTGIAGLNQTKDDIYESISIMRNLRTSRYADIYALSEVVYNQLHGDAGASEEIKVPTSDITESILDSGSWGDLEWILYGDNSLVVKGNGDMNAFYSSDSTDAWRKYKATIKTISIKKGVTSIGNYAFYNCTSLTSITIPDSVESIGYSPFRYCERLASITIPDSVTSIGSFAFSNCTSLKSITVPDSVTSLGERAFYYCTSLVSATLGNNVTGIGNYTFYSCKSLESVTLGNNVASIGSDTFGSCSNLKSITIPNSVTSIGDFAFDYCTSLKSIAIPNSVTSIGERAFYRCSSLEGIMVNGANPNYSSSDGVLFNKTKTKLITYPTKKSNASYTIPDSVTSIVSDAFSQCASLKSITIPNSVTSLGERAFYYCTSLANVILGNSVTSIGNYTFYGCSAITYAFFEGTYAQWQNVAVGSNNKCLTDKLTYYPTCYNVIFMDYDGVILDTQSVEEGTSAVASSTPVREGYVFIGWDTDFSCITEDIVVTAMFIKESELFELNVGINNESISIDTDAQQLEIATNAMTADQLKALFKYEVAIIDVNCNVIDDDLVVGTGAAVTSNGKSLTIIVNGDLDGDGITTATDVICLSMMLTASCSYQEAFLEAADVNGDDIRSASDYLAMKMLCMK